jgi:outer membrane protein insertion porin family
MAVGNVELTFPVYEKLLKGAVFYDVGNTWRRTRDYMSANFRSGAGIGIRVKTPLGPFKLDWGYPLSSNYEDKKEGQFYFSMTHGF